ncbi:MAG TPA: selenoneine biosynthesis selenosugar synthase SenB [Myxococcales bacterium]|nr:selenoneine biosynthesis selenosugar synthase SenB [Myxococcales bacterium]
MRVALVCPAPPGSRLGNRITALRWRRMLRELGHEAVIVEPGATPVADVLVALHARRSAESVRKIRERDADTRIVVALTGTDLYRDVHTDESAQRSLELADRLVVLHDGAAAELPRALRSKTRVVPQSAPPMRRLPPVHRYFEVAVVGHLRPEKDPFRAAQAVRAIRDGTRIRIVHAGSALSPEMREQARAEMLSNPRYLWLGELPAWKARRLIARARVLCITSQMEGGANVLSEAISAGTPVLASRIPAMHAILGDDYPGLFPFGDTRALSALLRRAEQDRRFLAALRRRCLTVRPRLSPARERAALRSLLAELA